MDKAIWGRPLWHSIHAIALGFPESPTPDDRRNYKTFYEMLQFVLPCSTCRDNFRRHLKDHPINLAGRDALFKWTVKMHNAVNIMTGKEPWTFEYAYSHYTSESIGRSPNFLWMTLIGILIILLIANLVYMSRRKP